MVADERRALPSGAPLGSLRSWVRDAVLGGALMPLGAMLTLGLLGTVLNGPPPPTFFDVLVAATLFGAIFGLILAAPAWGLARLCWRMPLLAFALGPVLGAGCACAAAIGIGASLWGAIWPSSSELRIFAAFGAFSVGPPWVGYLAVRSRDRSGMPAVLGSTLWVGGSAGLVFVLARLGLMG